MRDILKNKDIRIRILITLLILLIFRIGSNITVPGVDRNILVQMFSDKNIGLLELFNIFSGGAFSNFTVFALGVTPYITASIVVQLLTFGFPFFEEMAKGGIEGKRKLERITRITTLVLSLVQAAGITFGMFRQAVIYQDALTFTAIIVALTSGSMLLMWLGEQINEYGIGNGISILIFGGIISRIPNALRTLWTRMSDGQMSFVTLILIFACTVLLIAAVVMVQKGERRLPIQFPKKVVGRKIYGGQMSHIPFRVNQAGVIPIIFALSLLQFPVMISYFCPNSGYASFINKYLSVTGSPGVWVYLVLNFILIFFFTFFYGEITFKTQEIADNLKANGGSIPGIRPGKATEEYISNISHRMSFAGAVFLGIIACLPIVASKILSFNLSFGGTSLLIAVGVAVDFYDRIKNMEAQRLDKGFLR